MRDFDFDEYTPSDEELDALLSAQSESPNIENIRGKTFEKLSHSECEGNDTNMKKVRRPLRVLLVAAVVCALCVSALAVTDVMTDGRISAFLSIDKNTGEQLSGSATNVDVSATSDNITLSVVQTLGDKNNLYILGEMEFPDDITLDSGTQYWLNNLLINVEQNNDLPVTSYGYTMSIVSAGEHSLSFIINLSCDNASLSGNDINITFGEFGSFDENGELVPLSDGEWNVGWNLNYTDCSQEYQVGKDIGDGGAYRLNSLRISPLSLTLHMTRLAAGDYFGFRTVTLHYAD